MLENHCSECDLKQRDFIIDGINGIDFVQHKQENMEPTDDVVLQVHGVPITVNPESMLRPNYWQSANLGMTIEVSKGEEVALPALGSDNLVVLQVNGEARSFNTEKPGEVTLVANPV